MKIALFGARGMLGSRVAAEATMRGHLVTALGRENSDILDPESVAAVVAGHDAVLSAYRPDAGEDADARSEAAYTLLAALPRAGVSRLVVIGGAGSLEQEPGMLLMDDPEFPRAWRGSAMAHAEELEVYRADDSVEWTYVSPAAIVEPGERTGDFRVGGDQLLVDDDGQSRISAEDLAVAVVDELEDAEHVHERISVAY